MRRVEDIRVEYAVNSTSSFAGSEGLLCGAMRKSRLLVQVSDMTLSSAGGCLPFRFASLLPASETVLNGMYDLHHALKSSGGCDGRRQG